MKNCMADWIFNYNNITKVWNAVTRDNQLQLFNGGPDRISYKNLPTLLDTINKTNGDILAIKKLLKL